MKRTTPKRAAALSAALIMALGLAACGKNSTAQSTAETADSAQPDAGSATPESTAEDAYAYLASFDYSSPFDANGYLTGIKALDYVTLPAGYDALTLPAGTDQVSDDDVSSYITENVLSNFTTTQQVTDRAAASGDTVNIDYVGSVDGVEFDGGSTSGKGTSLVLGSGSYIDGFEDQVIGHTPGESFNIEVTFPENYSNADLSGKAAVFATTLNYISEKVTPELTDDWVATNLKDSLQVNTVAELQATVRKELLFSNESSAVYTQLSQGAVYADTLPAELSEYFTNWYLSSPYSYAQNYGMTLDALLTASGYDSVDAYLQAGQTSIDSSVKQVLLMQAVAESKGLNCDDATMLAKAQEYFGANSDSYITKYGQNYLKMSILHDLAMQNLIDTATVAQS